MNDPRTIDTVTRFMLPYPIAALYKKIRATHESSAKYALTLRLAEGIFRFLALVQLADAVQAGAPDDAVRGWLRLLKNPGMGKLLALFESTSKHVASGRFLEESTALTAEPWQTAATRFVDARNAHVHDEFHLLTNEEARRELQDLQEPLSTLLGGIQFLRDYRLGVVQGLRAVRKGFAYHWYAARGQEETCDPIQLLGQTAVQDHVVMLVHASQRALHLSPFLHWGLADGDRSAHLFWLHKLSDARESEQVVHYKHPLLRQEVVGRFPDASDPDAEGLSVAEWVKRRAEWPGRVDLALDSAAAFVDDARPPTFDERYTVVGKLGEGGMGTVWEVSDKVLERRCALKLLRPESARSPSALRRFLREGKALARITHPSVVQIYDVGVDSALRPFITMDVVYGEDLHERLQRAGSMTLTDVVPIVREILDGLQSIHEAGIVHRDVKPSNFILCEEGVRIIDFGIASMAGGTQLTQTVDFMGTPEFMAPEQWRGSATPASDVFAVGRLLFTLLAGRTPRVPDERLRACAKDVPAAIERVVRTATNADPLLRYPSARAMADALDAAFELGDADITQRAGAVPLGDAPKHDQALQIFERVERTFPSPIACAVREIPFAGTNPRTHFDAVLFAFDVTIRYLLALAISDIRTRSAVAASDLTSRLLHGSTLGAAATVVSRLGESAGEDADPYLDAGAQDFATRLVEHRNLVAHHTSFDSQDVRIVESLFAALLDRIAWLEDAQLFLVGVSTPMASDEAPHGAVPAMGAAPSGWWPEGFSGDRGAYVRLHRRGVVTNVALAPLVLLGERSDDLLLFLEVRDGAGGGVCRYLSSRTRATDAIDDPEVLARVSKVLDPRSPD